VKKKKKNCVRFAGMREREGGGDRPDEVHSIDDFAEHNVFA
jgi:hypothetical protein